MRPSAKTHAPMTDSFDSKDDARLAANIEIIKKGQAAQIEVLKAELAKWADGYSRPGNTGTITLALMEHAIERHLALFPK